LRERNMKVFLVDFGEGFLGVGVEGDIQPKYGSFVKECTREPWKAAPKFFQSGCTARHTQRRRKRHQVVEEVF
jgi:hypothetical protein